MKQVRRALLILAMLFALAMLLTGCVAGNAPAPAASPTAAPTEAPKAQVTVTFDLNYADAPAFETQKVDQGDVAEEPNAPVREHYQFIGWYNDAQLASPADFEYALDADKTFYAGWEQTEAAVRFYLNDGSEAVFREVFVPVNNPVTEPVAVPERSEYLFSAWYADEACTAAFDFATAITRDTAVYAGWQADDGSSVLVTYMWNYDGAPDEGVYRNQRVAYKSYLNLPTPDRGADYKFIYWYTDPECTAYFDNTKKIRESVTLYALWYNCATFEVEYTDVSGITGYGYSGSLYGTRIINKDQGGKANASNGWYVSYLYYKGITLTFNIHAEQPVENALLYMRLSAEYYDLNVTDEQFLVMVNGQQMKYGGVSIPINNAGSTYGVTSSSIEVPFQDYLVASSLSLPAGDSVIQLIVNNFKPENERTGTMYSYAPVVDAINAKIAGAQA